MEIKPPKYTRDLSLMNGDPLPRVPKYFDSVRPSAEWYAAHRKVNKKAYERLAMERDAQIYGNNLIPWACSNIGAEYGYDEEFPIKAKEPSDALYGELL